MSVTRKFVGLICFNDHSSSGLLLYAATVDLLAEDFLSHEAQQTLTKKDKIVGFCYVLAGGM